MSSDMIDGLIVGGLPPSGVLDVTGPQITIDYFDPIPASPTFELDPAQLDMTFANGLQPGPQTGTVDV